MLVGAPITVKTTIDPVANRRYSFGFRAAIPEVERTWGDIWQRSEPHFSLLSW